MIAIGAFVMIAGLAIMVAAAVHVDGNRAAPSFEFGLGLLLIGIGFALLGGFGWLLAAAGLIAQRSYPL